MSTVGLLGASAFQKPLFDVLTEDGHEVIVFSPQGPYPLLNGPHRTAFIDVRDVDALHAHAREVGIDFFVTDQTDLPIAAIHTLHARMGRPHLPTEVVSRFTDKRAMRVHGQACGLATPRWQQVSDVAELDAFWTSTEHRIVVKPPDSQGSRGVGIGHPDQLHAMFAEAKRFSASGFVLVESFIEGVEVPVEGCVVSGKYRTLAIGERQDFSGAKGIPAKATYCPYDPENPAHSALDSVVRAYVERSGAVDGITHAELMLTASNDATLVEIALRGGASFISSHIVPAVSGFAVGEHLIRSFSGTTTGPTSSLTHTGHNAGFHYFWSDRPMTAQELNTLRSLPDVLAAHLPEPGAEHPVGLPRHKPARLGPVAALHTDSHLKALADFAARHPHLHFT